MDKEKITLHIQEFISRLGFASVQIEILEMAGRTTFNIKTDKAHIFFANNEEVTRALTHLIFRTLEQAQLLGKQEHIALDINGRHQKHIAHIQENARALAARVQSLKHEIELPPMNSYERMIVHDALKDTEHVRTESRGEGPLRHVVIVYTV